ncbi:MAG: hypothetical protein WC356_01720 [Candidatus Micrarchaeia archaeon]|jgi:hypothetical protein
MAFPANLTNVVDGITDVLAAHINNLEAKVGVDDSAVATSLDYLVKSARTVQSPTSADTIDVDWSLGNHVRIVLNRSTTVINMSGGYDSQRCVLELLQDAVGGRAVTFGVEVAAGSDVILPVSLSASPNKTDYLGFFYNDISELYHFVSLSRGY